MAQEKKTILFLGNGTSEMKALFRYANDVPDIAERFDCLGAFDYDKTSAVFAKAYLKADIVVFSLFRRYGSRKRAEGIPALENRLKRGKPGILYSFGFRDEENSPLIWTISGKESLAEKIDSIPALDVASAEIKRLRELFGSAMFTVDGHKM